MWPRMKTHWNECWVLFEWNQCKDCEVDFIWTTFFFLCYVGSWWRRSVSEQVGGMSYTDLGERSRKTGGLVVKQEGNNAAKESREGREVLLREIKDTSIDEEKKDGGRWKEGWSDAFVVGDCLIHTKAEQRREEKLIKIWASVDLQ